MNVLDLHPRTRQLQTNTQQNQNDQVTNDRSDYGPADRVQNMNDRKVSNVIDHPADCLQDRHGNYEHDQKTDSVDQDLISIEKLVNKSAERVRETHRDHPTDYVANDPNEFVDQTVLKTTIDIKDQQS